MKLRELQEQAAKIAKDMRAILDAADEQGRDMTAEEAGQYSTLEQSLESNHDAQDKVRQDLERRSKLEKVEAELSRLESVPRHSPASESVDDINARQMAIFRSFLSSGGQLSYQNMQEAAALQMDSDTAGGVLVMPEIFVNSLIDGLDEALAIRGVASTFRVPNAASLGAPSLDNDPADDTWTSEIATGSADTTMSFGKRQLHPHPLAKSLKVSKTLLRKSAMPVDMIVRDRLLFKMGVTQEKAFMTGTGANQPLGLFTASADGISTSADVSTDNTTTAITVDGLINAKYSLKEQYLRSANLRWVFHRDAIKAIRKLKDGNGQYLWREDGTDISGDRKPTILDVPYIVSEYAPNTFTTGLYVGLIGDFRFYWIADALDPTIEVARELYMATNQDGYFIRSETDAMPVLEEAFARVTLA